MVDLPYSIFQRSTLEGFNSKLVMVLGHHIRLPTLSESLTSMPIQAHNYSYKSTPNHPLATSFFQMLVSTPLLISIVVSSVYDELSKSSELKALRAHL